MTTPTTVAANPDEQLSESLASAPVPPNFFRRHIPEFAVLTVWIGVVGFTLSHHEKWADEAQAWLLARDLDLYTLWFKELRYEGSPGLWHTILWVAQHFFHAPYSLLGPIGMICATAGVAFMLWKAPFPGPLRYLLAFSYFMVYQYAVVARPYVLFALFAFISAHFFSDTQRPERLSAALILLANLTSHGSLLAACLGASYALQERMTWQTLNERSRKRFVLCVTVIVLTFVWVFLIVKPPADVEALHTIGNMTVESVWHYILGAVGGSLFDYPFPSAIFLVLAGLWCLYRKKLIAFLLPVVSLISFYVYVRGWPHQQGTIFVAVITSLWIAWPSYSERRTFSSTEQMAYRGMIALLACLLAYQSWNAAVIIKHEYKFPYSGAQDTAIYLKSAGAEEGRIFGYLYAMVGVQAYFDRNILANRSTAYFHHAWPPPHGTFIDLAELDRSAPEYVVWPCWFDLDNTFVNVYEPMMHAHGYYLAHFSDGYVLSKRGWDVRQVYFIYRRIPRSFVPSQ